MKKYYILLILVISIIVLVSIFIRSSELNDSTNIVTIDPDSIPKKIRKAIEPALYPTQPRPVGMFYSVVLNTEDPLTELTGLVGSSNINIVLKINRIDGSNLGQGMTIIIPQNLDTIKNWEYLPHKISAAKTISKLVIISQPIQAFGVYENGVLVHSGPVSSGKESTQTKSGLFFVNWKGEETISTFDDEWILKWNMNIDNLAGISMHQYNLPGYPASHSCVRMTEADAYWLYGWTDEWTWENGVVVLQGTPVVVYSDYNFDNPAPWTLLPMNSKSTDTPRSILENLIKGYLPQIKAGAINKNN